MATETKTTTANADAPQGATPGTTTAPVAEVANLTGAQLAAAFSRTRQAASARPAPAEETAETQPGAANAADETPPAEAAPTPEEANTASTPESEGAEATTETTTETAASEAEPDAEPEPDGKRSGLEAMKERIDNLTGRFREAERERDALAKELEELKAQQPATTTRAAPLIEFGHDPEVRTLGQQLANLEAQEAWLDENPGGGEVLNAKGEVQVEISPEDAKALRKQVATQLAETRVALGMRKHDLRTKDAADRQAADRLASQHFPWSVKKGDPGHGFIQTVVERVPEIQRLPGWRLVAAAGWAKLQELEAQAKPAAAAAAARPPKIAPASGQGVRRTNGAAKGGRELAEAEAVFAKTGRPSDLKRVFTLRRQLSAAPA